MSGVSASPQNLHVHELQQAARHVSERIEPKSTATQSLSRLALLSLIEKLSWQARIGLTAIAAALIIMAGCGVLLIDTAPAGFGLRLLLWAILVIMTGSVCAGHLWRFRRGSAFAAKPFSWRAGYTARLSVFSASIGAGGLLLTPTGLSPTLSVFILTALGITGLVGAGLHAAHRAAALALALPILISVFIAAAFRFDLMAGGNLTGLLSALAGSVIVLIVIGWRSTKSATIAALRWPRRITPMLSAAEKARRRAYNPYKMQKVLKEHLDTKAKMANSQ
ncbi:MAG: hypothetical protein V3V30_05745 [Parvularculaceae bacterium]